MYTGLQSGLCTSHYILLTRTNLDKFCLAGSATELSSMSLAAKVSSSSGACLREPQTDMTQINHKALQ